jgi:tetratricopeptide (TPR) repeat protein
MRISLRNRSIETANQRRHGVYALHRLAMTVLLVPALFSVAVAQLEPMRDRGVHTLYGDIKVEVEPGSESAKVLSLEVQLYIINGTLIGRQTVTANGRYRFTELRDGEYDVVVLSENAEVARVRVRVQAVYKNDFRQDITLTARTDHRPNKAATISASDVYERTGTNKSLFEKSQKAVDEKKYDDALTLLGRLVDTDAKDFQAWTELGTVYLFKQRYEDSEQAYLKAIAERPSFFLAHMNLGKLRYLLKKFDGAIEPLTEAVKIQPSSADANYYLGESYLQIKKGSKAVGYLYEALKLDPIGRADAHLHLAALYNAVGLKDKAATEYREFLKKKPDYPDRKKLEQYITDNKSTAKTP